VLFFVVLLASGAALLALTVQLWHGRTERASGAVRALVGSPPQPVISITQHSSDGHQLLVAAGIALTGMAALSLALGWLLAGRFLRPLRTITTATREISATNLHRRLRLAGPDDELKELADTFDQLLDRLERSFAFERQFVANASHELRTPLAGMRTSLDVAMAKSERVPPHIVTLSDRLRRELDHVDGLLESFLTLAQSQRGPLADESVVSLADVARLAIERRAGAISTLGLSVEQQTCPEAWVAGSQMLLSRMVENVIDNSIRHNRPGGWVSITTAVEGQFARVVVENGGPILNPDEVKELTQPFRRIGAERTGQDNGAGLGLSIVASVAEVHDGTVDLTARSDGGLRVAIMLPLAVRPAAGEPA
jgi:hypothetical protein